MECNNQLKPQDYGLQICTSDVTCFDGNLECVNVPNGAGLNQVLNALATAICNFTPPPVSPPDASEVTYSGDLTYSCFTLTATNVEEAIQELATEICNLSGNVADTCTTTLCDIDPDLYACWLGNPTPGFTTLTELLDEIITTLCQYVSSRQGMSIVSGETGSAATGNYAAEDGKLIFDAFSRTAGTPSLGWRISGGIPTYSGITLDLVIDDGAGGESSYVVDGYLVRRDSETIVMTPNADNYVDVSDTGVYTITAVGIGSPKPPIIGLRLYQLTTNGVGVTVFNDLRNDYALDGSTFYDNSIVTRHITDLNVTGAKLENIGLGATVGDSEFIEFTYDTKGRITGASGKVDINLLTSLADGDLLQYNLANDKWVNVPIVGTLFPAGTNGQTIYYSGTTLTPTSFLRNINTAVGIDVVDGDPTVELTMGPDAALGFQLGSPTSFSATPTTGGSLSANTYYYVVQAGDGINYTIESAEASASVDGATTTAIDLSWDGNDAAVKYIIWRGNESGVYTEFQIVNGTSFTDDNTGWGSDTPSFPSNNDVYGIYMTSSKVLIGDRKDPLLSEMFSITNRSLTYSTLVKYRQYADSDGATNIFGADIQINSITRNTGANNIGVSVSEVAGSDVFNIGFSSSATESTAGDNIGYYADASNAGAGNAYAFFAANGQSHFLDQVYVSDIGSSASADASAIIEFRSTDKGVLMPRMTAVQASAIGAPSDGLVLYVTTTDATFTSVGFWGRESGVWVKL